MELGVLWEGPLTPTACHMSPLVSLQSSGSEDDKWLKRRKRSSARWRTKLFGLLRLTRRKTGAEEGEEQEEEEEEVEVEYISSSPASDMEPERWEPDTEVGTLGSPGEGEIGTQR